MTPSLTSMRGMSRVRAAIFAVLVPAGVACGNGETPGGPELDAGSDGGGGAADTSADALPAAATARFVLQAAGGPAVLPLSAGGVTLESAVFAVHELTVAGDNGSAKFEGSWPVDLSGGAVALSLRAARPGLYSRMVVKIEHLEGDVAPPAAFQGERLSARVSGTLPGGAKFSIRMASELAIDLVAAVPFDLEPGGRLVAAVGFDIGQWFEGISFPGGPGPIDVDAVSNPEILGRFRNNLVRSATLTFE